MIYFYEQVIGICIVLLKQYVFFLFGYDKRQAQRGGFRIPERRLLGFAACFGGAGAWLGMRIFRHKTKHLSFRILVPLAFLFQIALLVWYLLSVRHIPPMKDIFTLR